MVKMAGPIACPKLTGSQLKNSAATNTCLTPMALWHHQGALLRLAVVQPNLGLSGTLRLGKGAGVLTGFEANGEGDGTGSTDDQGHLSPVWSCRYGGCRCSQALEGSLKETRDGHDRQPPATPQELGHGRALEVD